MNAPGAAPEPKEKRRETNRARLEAIRTRRTPPLWPENVWLVGRDLANALPAPVAGDEWFDVEGCRSRPRVRRRALALRCAEEDVEAEAARYVRGCIGSNMAGFPNKPSGEEMVGALCAGAITERQQAIIEGLFAGMDASSDTPKEAGAIVTAVGLSQREAARALRNAGVTNPVVTNWLNDWALQCWEAQGGAHLPERTRAMQEPGRAERAGGPETMAARRGGEPGGHETVRNEEETPPPSGLWILWDEAEERGDRDVAALMWEAMYGRGAAG